MTKKEQIEEIYIDALNNDEAPNVFADRILFLFGVSKSVTTKTGVCKKCKAKALETYIDGKECTSCGYVC